MADDIPTERFSSKKYRVFERDVKKKTERSLGDFDTFELAESAMEESFHKQSIGWYSYSICNDNGVEVGTATGTKKKVFGFTKTNFSSTYSFSK